MTENDGMMNGEDNESDIPPILKFREKLLKDGGSEIDWSKVGEPDSFIDAEDPVLSELRDLFSRANAILEEYAPFPELSQEEIDQTFSRE